MKKLILLGLGWISLLFGLIGIAVPILPTTPLLLLTAILFAGNSVKCENWLKKQSFYEKYVVSYQRDGGLTLRRKLTILLTVYLLLLISGLMVNHLHVRIVLCVLAVVKLIVFIKIPTINNQEEVQQI
ncbi:DUF454 domain-containing protein [Pradoshia sp. D12]|uniref:DUF454 family protein n=1 Tax=Bacillaceae TaxID=186817 RepID=UPI00080AF6F2|nr:MULTISPECIES: DUF454 family protein [Bacillaceae]OCA86482.1 hypothetical protein A8L44_08750 [Bacillus sp. FJAT-27986]QFK72284.1 DUF454 domain-containing protein [Pradoshia sp. D12]TPF71223.1 DUF454 domain-containing protein [Bacillus sp. D12]